MSKTIVTPTLSLGNHIYLYRLLRDAIGCGKQTFMTQVEEALAAGDMAAYDLGFESTRELLEELDDCIKLTVFKGGRLYATVIANEAWNAALAKGEDKPKAAKGAKQSYKKKKRGEKDLKALRAAVDAKSGVTEAGRAPIFGYGAKWVTDQQTMKDASVIDRKSTRLNSSH